MTPGPRNGERVLLDVSELEATRQSPVRSLHVTEWVPTTAMGPDTAAVVHLSALHEYGVAQAAILRVAPTRGGTTGFAAVVEPAPVSGGARPVVRGGGQAERMAGGPMYSLVVDAGGQVSLERATGKSTRLLSLPAEVLDAEQVGSDRVWLSARHDTVVFGVDGKAWAVSWQGDGRSAFKAMEGVVHAAALQLPAGEPASAATPRASEPVPPPDQTPSPWRAPAPRQPASATQFVATDGDEITLSRPHGRCVLAWSRGETITDFTVRPGSTIDTITVVWREGTGCNATLAFVVVRDARTTRGVLPGRCPGRPAFSPDGNHLAWVSDAIRDGLSGVDPGRAEPGALAEDATVGTLEWADGPADEITPLVLPAEDYDMVSYDLVDWVWTEGPGTSTSGLLYLTGHNVFERPAAFTAPIQRRPDGTLVLPAGVSAEDAGSVIMVDSGRLSDATRLTYLLRRPGESPREFVLRRRENFNGGHTHDTRLPTGMDGTSGAVHGPIWMTARGNHLLIGDQARAWRFEWTGERWGYVARLPGAVRYAVPL